MDEGTGPPVIVIPGIQGRWEWMVPALRELRRSCRAISYSLCGDSGSGIERDPELGFENYLRQLDIVFERTGVEPSRVNRSLPSPSLTPWVKTFATPSGLCGTIPGVP